MKYEFSKTYDQQKAREYLEKLIKDESKCEVKKIHPKRSKRITMYAEYIGTCHCGFENMRGVGIFKQ